MTTGSQASLLTPRRRLGNWRTWFLRYPVVLWLLYALLAFVALTAVQNLWGGIQLRLATGQFFHPADTADPWYELGTSFGFWGMLFFGLNFILAARWRWVEDLLGGLDRAYGVHAWVGKAALIFLVLHLVILAVQAIPDAAVLAQYLVPFVDVNYTLGMVGVVLLLLLVALTIWVKLPYGGWLQTHKWMGVPYVAGSLHAILLQLDWYLILIMLAGCYAWLYRLLPFSRFEPVAAGQLAAVNVAGGITELQIKLSRPLAAAAGQFVFFKVRKSAAGLPDETHPFSLSGIAAPHTIRISAKAVGDYTRRLPDLQPGDEVAVSGPYGRFGARRELVTGPMLWVAGGIGITPFLSLLEAEMRRPPGPHAPITFVWSVRNRGEAVYLGEIEQAAAALPHVHFHLHVADDAGYLTGARLAALCGEPSLAAQSAFVCGPPAMMHSLARQCRAQGLKPANFISEEFAMR
jgi:predicted ferric reductase